MQFDEFWARALALFGKFLGQAGKNGREERLFISSWRPGKGFSDEEFPVRDVYPDRITCLSIHAGKAIEIPRDDMKTLYALWDDYLLGVISRLEIIEKIPRTTYAISLMKFLKENIA